MLLFDENGLECGKARPPEAGGLTMKKKSQSGTDRLWAIRSTVKRGEALTRS